MGGLFFTKIKIQRTGNEWVLIFKSSSTQILRRQVESFFEEQGLEQEKTSLG